jgi:hypothetical protein
VSRSTPASPNAANDAPVLLAFLAVAAALLAAFAWDGSLLASDDAIYAQAAREILAEGRFPDVTWQGLPLFEKGPVLFWALAGAQAALGPTMLALRLPGLLAGLGLLAALFVLARRLGLSRDAALAACGLLLATSLFYFNARRPMTDVPGAALGLAGFVALAFPGGRWRPVWGGVALGLAALTKLVAPVPFVLALGLLQFAPAFRRPRALAVGLAVAAAVALPWHVVMIALHGAAFVDVYFGYHLAARATRVLVGGGAAAAYADWVFDREWPTLAFVLAGLAAAVAAAVRRRPDGLAALALLAGAVLPLAAASTGVAHYLVPALPGVALGVGVLVDRVGMHRPRIVAAVAGALLAAAFVAANGRDLLRPDHGAGTRDACAALARAGLADDVAGTWNLHDPAVTWYCGTPGRLYADNEGVLAATRDIPMLKAWVVAAGDADLRALAAVGAVVITRPEPLPELLARAAATGVRPEVVANARSRIAVRLSARPPDAPAAVP